MAGVRRSCGRKKEIVSNPQLPYSLNDRVVRSDAKYLDNLREPLKDYDLVITSTGVKNSSLTIIGVFYRGRIYYLDGANNLHYTPYSLERGIYGLILGTEKPYFCVLGAVKSKMKEEGIIK